MGGMDGTADQMEAYSKEIRNAEKKVIDFYKNAINTTDEAIRPLLVNETWLTNEQALNLGFATIENLPMAIAYFTSNTNNKHKMTKEDKSWIENLFAPISALIKKPISNITVTDADGIAIDFADLVEGDSPKIDDMATIDGNPADGSYLMPEGNTYVFVGGVLTEIVEVVEEAPADNSEELQALKDENENLRQQLTALTTSVTNLKKQITSKLELNDKKDAKTEVKEITNKRTFLKN